MLAQHISTTIADFYLGHYNTTPPEKYQIPLTACHYYDTTATTDTPDFPSTAHTI